MAGVVKRLPLDEEWAKRAYCKGMNPDYWDLDTVMWPQGRLYCATECPVREQCLRDALQNDAVGVVRGGVLFDEAQIKHKTTECVFCHYPIVRPEEPGLKGVCWLCARYGDCARRCGRKVLRLVNMDSYHCAYCTDGKAD
jgi:hypothetical protein